MRGLTLIVATALTIVTGATGSAAGDGTRPFTFDSARVSIEGTSNVHGYTASTSDVRLTGADVTGLASGAPLDQLLQPGVLTVFEVTIPAASLRSPKEGIDKNMHKALKVQQHADIRFRLRSLTPTAGDTYQASGALTIAGVERDATLNLQVVRKGTSQLAVTGSTTVLMTDFGITPPKALMGMVKAHPKVVITLELVLGSAVS
jgi:polyisoprenoid-binding protein YceI